MVEANVFLVMGKVSERTIRLAQVQTQDTIVVSVEVMENVLLAMEQGNKANKQLI